MASSLFATKLSHLELFAESNFHSHDPFPTCSMQLVGSFASCRPLSRVRSEVIVAPHAPSIYPRSTSWRVQSVALTADQIVANGSSSESNHMGLWAMVGLDDMEAAREIVQDVCSTYFMFHGMDCHEPGDVFKYLPVLMFLEALFYQFDFQNERQIRPRLEDVADSRCSESQTVSSLDPFARLRVILTEKGLMTERFAKELDNGVEYWHLELSICQAVSKGSPIAIEDVIRAMHLRSTDYRALGVMLYNVQNKPVNEIHLNFLSVSELLGEILDDMCDYEDDVLANSFNVFRMFAIVYGPQDGATKLDKFIKELEDEYARLFNTLDPSLAKQYTEHLEGVLRKGRKGLRYAPGTIMIPSLIANEEEYRVQVSTMKSHDFLKV